MDTAEHTGYASPGSAPEVASATCRTGMVASSGVGQLTKMLNDYMTQMKTKDEWIDDYINNFASSTFLKDAKKKAIQTETNILNPIMNDIMELTAFLNNIILIENKFNQLYKPHKATQEAARAQYAPNIAKYEQKPKVKSEVGSFVELMFGGQTVHSGSFQKWLDNVNKACQLQGIKVIGNSGAHCKKIERAFYKSFYGYSSRDNDEGYKEMTDVIRCSIIFDSFDSLYKAYSVIEQMAEKELTGGILRLKDRFHPRHMPFGYRDLLINVYCPGSSIVCEMQLHHILFYKLKKISHQMYVRARLFEREGYNAAYDYATKYVRPRVGEKCYQVTDDDVTSTALQHDDTDAKEEEIDHRALLKQWKLAKYAQTMEDEGWEDPVDWHELTDDDLKNDLGFSKGHIKKFRRKYTQWQEEYEAQKKQNIEQKDEEDDVQNDDALLEAQRKLLEEQKRLEKKQKEMILAQEEKYKAELEKFKASNVKQWEHKVFVYESDFDENGIVYGLATEWGALPWHNPALNGWISMKSSNVQEDSKPVSALVGRQTIRFLCDGYELKTAWFSLDFAELRICPTYYTLRHYATWNVEALRYWVLEGSIDGVEWIVIKRHRNDRALNRKGKAASWSLNSEFFFSKFRVRMTRENDNKHWYLACSGIEIYGVVKRGAAALNLPKPVPTEQKEEEEEYDVGGRVFTYTSDFDTNGIIHWLGTNKGTESESFLNPMDRGLATVTSVKLAPNSVDARNILGKETLRLATDHIQRGWIAIDLGQVYVKPSKYTLKHYVSWDTEALRTWELHGSNGCRPGTQSEWLVLMSHTDDASLNRIGATKTWDIPPTPTDEAFNKFRLVITGENSNGHWYLACSGFEIYGQVLDEIPAFVAPDKPVNLDKERVFEYQSDFDTNGLLYYLGTYAKTRPWANPNPQGIVSVTASSLGPDSSSIDSFVGRTVVRCLTKDHKNEYMMLDLKGVRLNVVQYTLRHYSSWDVEALRNWNLEASNDDANDKNWMVLKSHVNDSSLHAKGASHTWSVHTDGWFRYFRIILTGPNDNKHYFLCCSGIELYGTATGGLVSNSPIQSDPEPPHRVFKYVGNDFDDNGLLHYLGTLGKTQKWSNPHGNGQCIVSASSIMANSESIIHFVGRTTVRCVTQETKCAYMMINLLGIRIKLTHYTLRHYSSWDTEALRNWDLEASHDGKLWCVLRAHKDDQSLYKKGQAVTWPVEKVDQFYKYFRIILTGANSNGHHYLACSGIELYGIAAGGIIKNPVTTDRAPPGPYRKFEYVSDFDTNGIIYWLGTRGDTQQWQNPAQMAYSTPITVQSTPLMEDSQPISAICGRSLVRCVTQDKENAYWLLNFGTMRVRPTHYTLKHYSSWDIECLRNWKLEGRTPFGTWKLIADHKNDTSLSKKGATATFTVRTNEFFQQLSLMMTGPNDNKHWHLACSGLEVYGICAGGLVTVHNANLDTLPADDVKQEEFAPGQGVVESLGKDILVVMDGECDLRPAKSGVTVLALTGFPTVRGHFNLKSGTWYYEVELVTDQVIQIGFADVGFVADSANGKGIGDSRNSWAYDGWRQKKWNGDNSRYGGDIKWKTGDIVGCCLDYDHGEIRYYINGMDLGIAFNGIKFSEDGVFPAVTLSAMPQQSVKLVFDAAYLKHPIPYGFDAINTCNFT
eukprot:520531_1